ncbi:hypothetical protein GPECTOR_266g685 [Gonium pectorale]|uniref:Uncharacterized protein n=1 Tax=Gonium pectorale TaxID=33097 RepID=A0A150FW56_GONPE|nr:hypothetical protein GPECTOR_266g685 [Gonium pectorale]|eukprot:KXZ41836.1 hypothetical protein GPECTOR_266g685 [Gonium pectorale]
MSSGNEQVLMGTFSQSIDFQYRLNLNGAKVSDAEAVARTTLKRKCPEAEDAELVSIKAVKKGARPVLLDVDVSAPMDSDYELQFESPVDLITQRKEDLEFKKFHLQLQLLDFGSRMNSRIISKKHRESSPATQGMRAFISNKGNREKVQAFMDAVGCHGLTPEDYATASDKDRTDRNNMMHANSDDSLESEAKRLVAMGAVRLLKNELTIPCMYAEHFSAVKEHLFA